MGNGQSLNLPILVNNQLQSVKSAQKEDRQDSEKWESLNLPILVPGRLWLCLHCSLPMGNADEWERPGNEFYLWPLLVEVTSMK